MMMEKSTGFLMVDGAKKPDCYKNTCILPEYPQDKVSDMPFPIVMKFIIAVWNILSLFVAAFELFNSPPASFQRFFMEFFIDMVHHSHLH
mmetsp:Transcript_18392/g.26424  ORF Transcript_18392/g.26424 Transcript_18392/m.26424 type:complete len:90 (-) Transcript_18392:128-397(-)